MYAGQIEISVNVYHGKNMLQNRNIGKRVSWEEIFVKHLHYPKDLNTKTQILLIMCMIPFSNIPRHLCWLYIDLYRAELQL